MLKSFAERLWGCAGQGRSITRNGPIAGAIFLSQSECAASDGVRRNDLRHLRTAPADPPVARCSWRRPIRLTGADHQQRRRTTRLLQSHARDCRSGRAAMEACKSRRPCSPSPNRRYLRAHDDDAIVEAGDIGLVRTSRLASRATLPSAAASNCVRSASKCPAAVFRRWRALVDTPHMDSRARREISCCQRARFPVDIDDTSRALRAGERAPVLSSLRRPMASRLRFFGSKGLARKRNNWSELTLTPLSATQPEISFPSLRRQLQQEPRRSIRLPPQALIRAPASLRNGPVMGRAVSSLNNGACTSRRALKRQASPHLGGHRHLFGQLLLLVGLRERVSR